MKTLKITKLTMEKRVSRFTELKPLPIQIDENIPQKGKDIVCHVKDFKPFFYVIYIVVWK